MSNYIDIDFILYYIDIFQAISTTKENKYAVTVYGNDFDKTSSSLISYTQTDSAVEHQSKITWFF